MLYDKDIREPLFEYLEEQYYPCRIIEELSMGRSRADAVMVTKEDLYGIEIKSDADTYVRLSRQVKDYNLYYDFNYVVVGGRHANHIEEHVPQWWGIMVVEQLENGADFYVLRQPTRNPKDRMKRKMMLLWRPELAHIQELNGLPKYKQKSKKFVRDKILEKISPDQLQLQLCEELLQRDYSLIEEQIAEYKSNL